MIIPHDFDFNNPVFVNWAESLPPEHQRLMRGMSLEQLGELSGIQLQRRALLYKQWLRSTGLNPDEGSKGNKESAEERRQRYVLDIMEKWTFKTLRDSQEIVFYHGGRYNRGAEVLIKEGLQSIGGFEVTNFDRAEVLSAIKALTGEDRIEFDSDPKILNLRNGLFNIDTGEFKEHTKEYLSLVQLPTVFDPKATCPEFIKFLRATLDPEHVLTIVKLIAYCLLRNSNYEKAFMLVGEGSNGKSTLIKTIIALLGRDNCSNKSLQELTGDRFAKAELFGKMANLFSDIPSDKLAGTGDFKMLVSGDRVSAQRKFEHPFSFENYAKMIFSANQIPQTDDQTYAYYRRWVIIPFNRTFEAEEADECLIEKLTTPEELSGILNLALKAVRRLRDEHGFKETDLADIKRQYELGASRIGSFLAEQCIVQAGNEELYVESGVLKEAYRRFCREHGTRYYDERKFGEQLKAISVVHRQKRQGGRARTWCYFGIALKAGRLDVTDKSGTLCPIANEECIVGEEGTQLSVTSSREV